MWTTFAVAVIFVALSGVHVDAADCCAAYDDLFGTHHDTQLCENYCCFALDKDYVQCCDDPDRQAPPSQRTDDCIVSWMHDNFWMLIVGGVGIVIFVSLLCVCCCRRRSSGVILHTVPQQTTTVTMMQSTVANPVHPAMYHPIPTPMVNPGPTQMVNPAHYGYDQ